MSTNNSGNSTGGGGGGGNGGYITWTVTTGNGGWTIMNPPIPIEAKPEAKKKSNKDGCDCKKCKEKYEWAEPNQEDGSFVCWECRNRNKLFG